MINEESWEDIKLGSPGVKQTDHILYREFEQAPWLRITRRTAQEGLSNPNIGISFLIHTDLERDEIRCPKTLQIFPMASWMPDPNHSWLVIELDDVNFKTQFLELVHDLTGFYETFDGDDEENSESVLDRLERWVDFFTTGRSKGLSPEKRRGLYGEMVFLRDYLIPTYGSQAVEYWKGIKPELVDFAIKNIGVEVKTSASSKPFRVKISNSKQLDDENWNELYLFHLALTVTSGEGHNLITLYNEIKDQLKPSDATVFDSDLKKFGFYPTDTLVYQSEKYTVNETRFYRVRDDFPRITPVDLKNGVGKVKYSVDLSAASQYEMPEDKFKAILDDLKS